MTNKPTLIVEDSSGSTKAMLEADTAEKTEEYRQMDRAQAVVDAEEWNAVSLDSRSDRLVIQRPDGSTLFGGRYDDDQREGDATVVQVASYMRDAIDAEPTAPNLMLQNTADSEVVQTLLIDAVPTLSAGTIETLAPSLSYSFPNSSRAQVGKTVATATGGEFHYNADRTVDYVDRLGSDLGIVISPDNRNVVGEPRVTQDVRDDVTHIKGFGAGDGPNQVRAEAVASSFSGGRQVWREFEDTDIKEQSRLQTIIDRLVEEMDGEPRKTTVEATLIGVDVALGDRLEVVLPDRGIDRMLRITKLIERYGEQGREYLATLTNRQADDDLEGNEREVRQRVNRGYGGYIDRNVTPSGWNVAGDGHPQTLTIPDWPDDIEREDVVKLVVQGRPWRSPVSSSGHSHDVEVTHPSHDHSVSVHHPSHDHSIDTTSTDNADFESVTEATASLGGGALSTSDWTAFSSITPSGGTSEVMGVSLLKVTGLSSRADPIIYIRLRNTSTGETYGSGIEYQVRKDTNDNSTPSSTTVVLRDPTDCDGQTVQFEYKNQVGDAEVSVSEYYVGIGKHTHEVSDTTTTELGATETATSSTELGATESSTSSSTVAFSPTIVEQFNGNTSYPTDVEVSAGGQTITTLSGDSSQDWQETLDLKGVFSPGQQRIAAEPKGQRGSLNLTLQSELFRTGPNTN
ncbi:hypothetical protein [Haloarcula montana]|uniref:hypothetical protein n=1 Tax=Haloarcula montana TaxID=3111776 RepID=UPI002D78C504|nr:hypothetical protein [Haloarcula sp. GH36]